MAPEKSISGNGRYALFIGEKSTVESSAL